MRLANAVRTVSAKSASAGGVVLKMLVLDFLEMRYVQLLVIVLGPSFLLFAVISPHETWRDIKFACGGRLLRRGLRFRLPFRQRKITNTPKVQFSLRTLFVLTTLLALPHVLATWFAVDVQSRVVVIILTTSMGLFWLCGAYLSSCNIPRRQHRKDYRRPRHNQQQPRLPKIDTGQQPRCHPSEFVADSLEFEPARTGEDRNRGRRTTVCFPSKVKT